jgi:hypothetical protein
MFDPDLAQFLQLLRRVAAMVFFGMLGVVLCLFTAVDVVILFLARKRRAGLGAHPVRGALWQLLLWPTRPAFWAVGFWLAFAALFLILLRFFSGDVPVT